MKSEVKIQKPNLTNSVQIISEVRKYLDDFFTDLSTEDIDEYQALYNFWCTAIKTIPLGGRVLELGTGPTLYTSIPLAERFTEIHLADYFEEPFVEVIKWLRGEPGCYDWRPFIKLVLEIEEKQGSKNASSYHETAEL
jgi:hypothetical protein